MQPILSRGKGNVVNSRERDTHVGQPHSTTNNTISLNHTQSNSF
jgi:hypothetical protein